MGTKVYRPARDGAQPKEPKPSLLVQTVSFHEEDRGLAERLGFELYDLLTRSRNDKLAFGPGIPVRIAVHPEEVELNEAEHVVVVPVLGQGALLNQDARNTCISRLEGWLRDLTREGVVLPIPTSPGWTQFLEVFARQPVLQCIYDDKSAGFSHTTLEIVLATCRLLRRPEEEFHVFISHAKSDLESTQRAAQEIRKFVDDHTTADAFYDTTDLESGANLKDQLKAAAGQGIFLAVRSDGYGSRHWCQRELLWAKEAGLPTLTVEVLRNGEPRSYPYGGNGPAIVWSERPEEAKTNALRVVLRAMVEWLRARHFRLESPRLAAGLPESVTLTRPPELLDLAQGPLLETRPPVVLHPDPELSFAEREVLRASRPRLRLVTPTTLYRSIDVSRKNGPPRAAALRNLRVALSVSDVIDEARVREGIRQEHAQDALVHVTRALIGAGAEIAYGGDLRRGGYDELFIDLIRTYNETGVDQAGLLHSYLPATSPPIQLREGMAFNLQKVSKERKGAPPRLDRPEGELSRARAALYLSETRQIMSVECAARILLGGKTLPRKNGDELGYGGAYPGVVEEAWHTLRPGSGGPKPLYIVGGFGGAAALVAALGPDALATPLLQSGMFVGQEYSEYRAVAAEFAEDPDRTKLGVPPTPEALAADIRDALKTCLATDEASKAWNGLTVEENRELFWSRDTVRLTSLILKGLFHVRAAQIADKLEIELVAGNIVRTERANAIVLPVFEDVPITGAGAALDKATGGAVSAARDQGKPMIALTTPQVDADWLVLANLGPFRDKARIPRIIKEQAERISQLALRHGFGRISLVTFAATVLSSVEQIAEQMLAGFASLPDATQLQWFEAEPRRFERLKAFLESRPKVAFTHKTIPDLDPEPAAPSSEDLVAIVRRKSDELRCTLLLPSGPAVSVEHVSSLTDAQLAALNRATEDTAPELPSLDAMGSAVADLLFDRRGAGELEKHASDRRLVIQHDAESAAIPFETLRVGAIVPGLGKGLVRRLSLPATVSSPPLQRPPTAGELNVLLVVNPTGDLPHAEREAEAVHRQLAEKDGITIRADLKRAQATRAGVLSALTDPTLDVLHYCGHAAFERAGANGSGLVCADGALTLQDLQDQPIGPRIVFFNACQSARVRNGETTTQVVAKAFAEAVLRSGVEAYLGTFWPVRDEAAARFAAKVYLELARGEELHRAVTTARRALREEPLPDWANYVLFGTGSFKLKTR